MTLFFSFFCYISNINLIILFSIIIPHNNILINITKFQYNNLVPAIYSITSKKFGQYNNLLYRHNIEQKLYFSNRNTGSMKNIRFIPIKDKEGGHTYYYIEFTYSEKKIGINESDYDSIILYDNISEIQNNQK